MGINDYGFVEAGRWELKETLKSGITFKLHRFDNDRVMYAFVTDDDVMYIGICDVSTTTLKYRMERYKSWAGAGHNKEIAQKIKRCLLMVVLMIIPLEWLPQYPIFKWLLEVIILMVLRVANL